MGIDNEGEDWGNVDNEGEDWSTNKPTYAPYPMPPMTLSPTIDLLGRLEDLKGTYYCAVSWDQIDCENAIPCPSGDAKGKIKISDWYYIVKAAHLLLNLAKYYSQSARKKPCRALVVHLARRANPHPHLLASPIRDQLTLQLKLTKLLRNTSADLVGVIW